MKSDRRIERGASRATTTPADVLARVPRPIRVAAALSWRCLLILGALGVVFWVLGYLAVVTIPVGIALLLSAMLAPVVGRLVRWKVPRALATPIAVIAGLAVVVGVFTLVITTVSTALPQLRDQVGASIHSINQWLQRGPLHLSQAQLQQIFDNIVHTVQGSAGQLTSRALTTAAALGEGLTGLLLTLFTLIFFLHSGTHIWTFLMKVIPEDVRDRVDVAGRRGFASLVSYVRATIAVAFVDAACIGLGIWLVGVPLAVPLAALIFIGAFVPIVGAVVTGAVAVLVALVTNGLVAAVIVLAVVVGVMQLEGHVLQPFLLGRAVRLHPLAVVLAIAVGVVVAGIVGALLAVPILAVVNAGVRSLLHDPDLPPDGVDVLRARHARPVPEQPGNDASGQAGTGASADPDDESEHRR